MLNDNEGKLVRYTQDGLYVLVVFSRPLGFKGDEHIFYALKRVGTLQLYGDRVFSPYEPSPSGQKDYFGYPAPKEVQESSGPPKDLHYYTTIGSGWTLWENVGKYVQDRKSGTAVEFADIPSVSPLVDGHGWNRIQSYRNREHFLSLRETPHYNHDIKWHPSASKSGHYPFHFAYYGYETHKSDRTTCGTDALVGHLSRFREDYDLSNEQLLDPTLRHELRVH